MAEDRSSDNDIDSLTETFRAYGAPDPEEWARSQINEGIPQLALFSFAKSLWAGVLSEDDTSWIDEEIRWSDEHREEPCAQAGAALREMLARDVSRSAIIDLVRVVQYEALYHACAIIDGARVEKVPITSFLLFQTDEEDQPIVGLPGTHEVLFELDPTGRELRPRPPAQP